MAVAAGATVATVTVAGLGMIHSLARAYGVKAGGEGVVVIGGFVDSAYLLKWRKKLKQQKKQHKSGQALVGDVERTAMDDELDILHKIVTTLEGFRTSEELKNIGELAEDSPEHVQEMRALVLQILIDLSEQLKGSKNEVQELIQCIDQNRRDLAEKFHNTIDLVNGVQRKKQVAQKSGKNKGKAKD